MQSTANILTTLNDVLTGELTAINHYFLHARMFKNWGLEGLNNKAYKKSIKNMKQADDLIERILMLEGLPNLQKLESLQVGEHAEEMLKLDVVFETKHIERVKKAIVVCESEKDFVSRGILESILESAEDYFDWLDTQHHLIKTTGIENYLQSQISEEE